MRYRARKRIAEKRLSHSQSVVAHANTQALSLAGAKLTGTIDETGPYNTTYCPHNNVQQWIQYITQHPTRPAKSVGQALFEAPSARPKRSSLAG